MQRRSLSVPPVAISSCTRGGGGGGEGAALCRVCGDAEHHIRCYGHLISSHRISSHAMWHVRTFVGCAETPRTTSVCPSSVWISCLDCKSHMYTRPSSEPGVRGEGVAVRGLGRGCGQGQAHGRLRLWLWRGGGGDEGVVEARGGGGRGGRTGDDHRLGRAGDEIGEAAELGVPMA